MGKYSLSYRGRQVYRIPAALYTQNLLQHFQRYIMLKYFLKTPDKWTMIGILDETMCRNNFSRVTYEFVGSTNSRSLCKGNIGYDGAGHGWHQ